MVSDWLNYRCALDGKQELWVGTGDVNKASRARGTTCATV